MAGRYLAKRPLTVGHLPDYSFVMVATSGAGPSNVPGIPGNPALPDAAKLIKDAAGVEETRFNNLNSRAIALLSATSLVTALAGLFSKEISDLTKLEHVRPLVVGALVLTLILLVLVARLLVLKVLIPNRRVTFGDNELTNTPEALTDLHQVHAVAFKEYVQIHESLVDRNRAKAEALHNAYRLFLATVVVIAFGAAAVAVNSLVLR